MKFKYEKKGNICLILSTLLWIISIILMIDYKSFNENIVWPLPYKDANSFSLITYFVTFAIFLISLYLLTLLKKEKKYFSVYILIVFEIYTYLTPLFFKTGNAFDLYLKSLFDITQQRFYTRTLKSLIFIISLVLLIIALKSTFKKTLYFFILSTFLMLTISIIQIIIINSISSVSLKDITNCIIRFLPILPLYFLNDEKSRITVQKKSTKE